MAGKERTMNEIKDYEIIDKAQELNAVSILDKFCKTFCRYADDYERFNDLRFRCEEECPFSQDDGKCSCKIFKNKFAPNYKDFGCMGDL